MDTHTPVALEYTRNNMPRTISLASLIDLDEKMRKKTRSRSYVKLIDSQPFPLQYTSFDLGPEDEDALHDPDPPDPSSGCGGLLSWRGFVNIGCLILLVVGLVALFGVLPIATSFMALRNPQPTAAYSLGGINATGQVPVLIGNFGLIDNDTPQEAYTHTSLETGNTWDLVF
jgi:hypothetical protein